MAKIRDIYTSDAYYPFLCYCESHGYEEMHDLVRCPFAKLKDEPDITMSLISRIRVTYLAYLKAHPEEFLLEKKKVVAAAARAPKTGLDEAEEKLRLFFRENADRLIHVSEAVKAIAPQKLRRVDVAAILAKADWCRLVDNSTYFYCGER